LLKGFEKKTRDLSQVEKERLLPLMLCGFRKRIGKSNAVSSSEIIDAFKEKYGIDLSDVIIRKIVNHIRNKELLPGLVASSAGYYVTMDPSEVKRHIDSLSGRESEIRRTKESMIRYYKRLTARKQSNIELEL
jgi:hypothetical protein